MRTIHKGVLAHVIVPYAPGPNKNDVDDLKKNELLHLKKCWNQCKPDFDGSDVYKVFEWMAEIKIINIFPNIHIAIRIYLTISITNFTAERAF